MNNQPTKPQIDIERAEEGSGLGSGQRLDAASVDGKKEDVPQIAKSREDNQRGKKPKFDKEGHLLIRQGHPFRKDHLKIYKIHAALKGTTQQELINKALEYYKVNVLSKSEAQKLKEAGQEELDLTL